MENVIRVSSSEEMGFLVGVYCVVVSHLEWFDTVVYEKGYNKCIGDCSAR